MLTHGSVTGAATMPSQAVIRSWEKTSNMSQLAPIYYFIGIGENWKNILELGTGFGVSTTTLTEIAKVNGGLVITVDREDMRDKIKNLTNYKFIQTHTGDTYRIKNVLKNNNIEELDCLFIDADHHADSIREDFHRYKYLVKPGGFVIFHDVVLVDEECEGSEFWFNEDFGEGFEKLTLSFCNGLGILRKIDYGKDLSNDSNNESGSSRILD